jgi:hypothetical protein
MFPQMRFEAATQLRSLKTFSHSALENWVDLVADLSEPRTNPNNPNPSVWQCPHQKLSCRAKLVLAQPRPETRDRPTVIWVIRNVKPLIHLQGSELLSERIESPGAQLFPGAQDDVGRRNATLLATQTINREPLSKQTLRAHDLPAAAVSQGGSRYEDATRQWHLTSHVRVSWTEAYLNA